MYFITLVHNMPSSNCELFNFQNPRNLQQDETHFKPFHFLLLFGFLVSHYPNYRFPAGTILVLVNETVSFVTYLLLVLSFNQMYHLIQKLSKSFR
jgi:hypothetical protein